MRYSLSFRKVAVFFLDKFCNASISNKGIRLWMSSCHLIKFLFCNFQKVNFSTECVLKFIEIKILQFSWLSLAVFIKHVLNIYKIDLITRKIRHVGLNQRSFSALSLGAFSLILLPAPWQVHRIYKLRVGCLVRIPSYKHYIRLKPHSRARYRYVV